LSDPAWTPDLAVFSGLLLLTAAFGRPFSKLAIPGTPIYVTEIALVAIAVLLVRRVGVRGIVDRVRVSLPVVALLLLWLAGAIATLRGLATWGLDHVTHDVALVEYSVVLPILAVAADTAARRQLVFRVLVLGGLLATVVFAFVYFVPALANSGIGLNANGGSSVGLYLSLVALPVAVALAERERLPWWLLAAAGVALVLMSATVTRSVILALAVSLVVLVVLARRGRRVVAAAVAATALGISVGGAAVLQQLGWGIVPPGVAPGQLQGAAVTVAPGYVADDAGTAFQGGLTVVGDAAAGDASRELARGEAAVLEEVRGLTPGQVYTVVFWVKPLEARRATGRVGDTWRGGWAPLGWAVDPERRWQRLERDLRATRATEFLAIELKSGASRIRVDGVEIAPRAVPERTTKAADPPGGREPGVRVVEPEKKNPLVEAFRATFDADALGGGFNENQRWRLAYWRYMLGETAEQPLLGAGFGTPSRFVWRGVRYDFRTGADDPNDVTPPHNSFVNLIYRTGVVGTIPFLALVGIGLWRWGRALRRTAEPTDRMRLVSLGVLAVFIAVTAFFNGALEGPFMGIFFWTVLGLMLLWRQPEPGRRADAA
jgi:O-antigen ligase